MISDGFGGYNAMDYLPSQYDSAHYESSQYDPTQPYDTQHYDNQHYESSHYDTANYDTSHYDTTHYDNQHYDSGHYDTNYDSQQYDGHYMSPHLDVLTEPVKPFHTDYVNCESFSTRYTDGSFEECPQGLGYSMDSLTESMLKQLDTPRLIPTESDVPDSLKLSSLDPMVRRLYDTCVSLNSDTDSSPDINGMKKDRLRGRRGRRRPEKGVTPVRTFTPRSPPLKAKPRPVTRPSFSGLNYAWLKDSFFNCQILGNVAAIAQDQTGCRMLQRQLECSDTAFTSAVLREVLDNLFLLMTDPFGNYLCQKLMSVCDAGQLGDIITGCETQFIPICLNMHGTRAIQKLIEVVSGNNVNRITAILSAGVVELINDLNGNHVIQKCLVALSSDDCEFIYRAMNEHCVGLATHRHGCCVMQRCIDAASPAQRAKLVDTIAAKTLELVEDAYGNYVIQYVLRLRDDAVNARIVSLLCEDLTKFSKHKFSSNVVERCLIFCPSSVRSNLVSRFLNLPFSVLHDLILDPFGNYVIQRVLNVAQPDELAHLLDIIQPHLEELKLVSSGKRIAAKISRKSSSLENSLTGSVTTGGSVATCLTGSVGTVSSVGSVNSVTSVGTASSVGSVSSVGSSGVSVSSVSSVGTMGSVVSDGFTVEPINSSCPNNTTNSITTNTVNSITVNTTNSIPTINTVATVDSANSDTQDYSMCPGNLGNDYPSLYSVEADTETISSKGNLTQGTYSQVIHRLKSSKDYILNLITKDTSDNNRANNTVDNRADNRADNNRANNTVDNNTGDTGDTVENDKVDNGDAVNVVKDGVIESWGKFEELSMEFPSLGPEKFEDDPLVRDFCGIFSTGYDEQYKQSYKIWSNL